MVSAVLALASGAMAQKTLTGGLTTGSGPYVPGVTFQSDNPNYMNRNPFFFEGRVDWNLLGITTPTTVWEYVQRGIHYQDDLQDTTDAISDYQTAISMNSVSNGTCQIFTTTPPVSPNVNPPPCMFTPRLRLGNLLMQTNPSQAIALFQQVLQIDALRLGVNEYIGEAYEVEAAAATSPPAQTALLQSAIAAYQAELALSPVTATYTSLTGDTANNAHVHWSLAGIYAELGDTADQITQLQAYLAATQWHSDTYPWRIQLAKARLAKLAPSDRPAPLAGRPR
jgi:tetratricopeptide (TPR) repeat protein